MSVDDQKVVDVETVLTEVNNFGPFQWSQYALALLPALFVAISNANYVFVAESVSYRCTVPECENANGTTTEAPVWWPQDTEFQCRRPQFHTNTTLVQGEMCTADMFDGELDCDQWIYEPENSLVAEFGLACQEWRRALIGTIHNVGVLLSMPLMGFVSDKWGRRTAVTCSAVGLIIGALKALVSDGSYYLYLLLELLEATVAAAIYTTSYVMVLELGGKNRRVMSTALLGIIIAVGETYLSLIAWLVPHWRNLLLVIYCPALIFFSYVLLLKESVRWLLINGKWKEAKSTLADMASLNKLKISPNVLRALDEGTVVCDKESDALKEEFSFKLLFSSKILLKWLVICSWWWFTSAFVYYGLMINSVSLPGDKYVNFCLSSLVAIPGDLTCMLLLDRFGRKKTLSFGFVFCGICCIANGFIPLNASGVGIAMFLLGKASVSLCFNGVYVYTSELFPTSARSTLVGCCSMFARIGSIIAPLTPLLRTWWWSLPTVVFGGVAICGGAMVFLTPDTWGRDLPDTVAQAEKLDKPHNRQDSANET